MGATIAALRGWRADPDTSAASFPPPPRSLPPVSRLRAFSYLLNVSQFGPQGSQGPPKMRHPGDGSPHDRREQPWKPADADVLIWTSCVRGGDGLTGTARGLQPTPRVQRGGRRGPRPGEGRRERRRTQANIRTWFNADPCSQGGVGGWVEAPFYQYTEPRKRAGAQVKEKQVQSPRASASAPEGMRPPPTTFPILALIQCKLWKQARKPPLASSTRTVYCFWKQKVGRSKIRDYGNLLYLRCWAF